MSEQTEPGTHVLKGRDVLDLHIQRLLMAERSLATEREIVIKNYAAFGAVMLFQSGFLANAFEPSWVITTCGIAIIAISVVARVMSIYYARYSKALFMSAHAAKKAALRGRDSLYVERKEREADLPGLHRQAEEMSWRDFFTDTTVLGVINILPAAIGAALVVGGLFIRP